MKGGEGIVCVAKSSWKTCMSVQGKAESTRFVAGWAYCFIVWKVLEIEQVVVVVHGIIVGHWR